MNNRQIAALERIAAALERPQVEPVVLVVETANGGRLTLESVEAIKGAFRHARDRRAADPGEITR